MTDNSQQTSSQSITKMIEQVLERGETALVVTTVAGPGTAGSKLLILENGDYDWKSWRFGIRFDRCESGDAVSCFT